MASRMHKRPKKNGQTKAQRREHRREKGKAKKRNPGRKRK